MTLKELWRWGPPSNTPEDLSPLYASSWLWFHYLLNHHGPRFQDFQMRLARAEEPHEAFEMAFEGAGDLEAGVQAYLAGGEFGLWEFPLEAVATELQVRELEGAEVHAIRARLHLLSGAMAWEERKKAAQLEVAQALRENPTNVSAVRLQADFTENHAERLALAQPLVKAHPDSGPAWGLLAGAHAAAGSPMAVQEQALLRAVELSPDDAGAHDNLAWLYVQTNVPRKGYEPALRAVKRAPYSPSYVDTYAAVLFGMGQCDKSISTQRRAIELLDEKAPKEVRQELLGRLTKYETACREREAAGAPAPGPPARGLGDGAFLRGPGGLGGGLSAARRDGRALSLARAAPRRPALRGWCRTPPRSPAPPG